MRDMTRRSFLKTAVAGAAVSNLSSAGEIALGAPAVLAGPVDDLVRYGFIGTGSRGSELLRFLTTIPA